MGCTEGLWPHSLFSSIRNAGGVMGWDGKLWPRPPPELSLNPAHAHARAYFMAFAAY